MELEIPNESHSVIIVGGGPVGLAAALDFAGRGIKTVLLEASRSITHESKAICWSQRTLEILDRSGAASAMVRKGVVWKTGRVFRGEKELYNFDLQVDTGYKMPAFINLQQYYVEQLLIDRIIELNKTDVRRGHEVVDISITLDHRALVTVKCGKRTYSLVADYVLAADGVKSTLRNILGLGMTGQYFDEKFLITDVKVTGDFPFERRFWFEPKFHKGQSALLHVQPDNILRIDLQLGPGANVDQERGEEKVEDRIQKILGVEFNIEWISVYSFSCKRLEKFTHGPIFFVGDSAHVVSPFGARGGNGGVQDIDNLVWKMSLVVNGEAPPLLLKSFDEERIPAAEENLLNSARSTDFMTPKTQASQDFRNAVFDLSEKMPFARSFINSGRLSAPFCYSGSYLCTKDDPLFERNGVTTGSASVDAPILNEGEKTWLLDHLGRNFCLLIFVKEISTVKRAVKITEEIQEHFEIPVECIFISPTKISVECDRIILEDRNGSAFLRWAAEDGTTYLVRPDQHVAARWLMLPAADIVTQALRKSMGY